MLLQWLGVTAELTLTSTPAVATVRQGSLSAPAPATARVQQQGALSAPASLARSHIGEQQITLQSLHHADVVQEGVHDFFKYRSVRIAQIKFT